MTEHTPGPWHVRMQRVDPRPYIYAGDVLVAKTYRTTIDNRLTQEIGEANAALIVAAPDMLKVLEQLEWDGYDYLGNPTCPACAQRQTVGHYPDCELSAAIKKAKGQ